MEQERYRRYEAFYDWTGDPEPLFVAVEEAIDAAQLPEGYRRVELTWKDRQGTYHSIGEARERLRHAQRPEAITISTRSITSADNVQPATEVSVGVEIGGGGTIHVFVDGTDWPKAGRAYEAVTKIIREQAVEGPPRPPEPQVTPAPVPQPSPPMRALTTPEPDHAPTAAGEPAKRRGGVVQWMNDNQGLLAVVGIVVAVVLGVIALLAS